VLFLSVLALTECYAIANAKYKYRLVIAGHGLSWQSAAHIVNSYEDVKVNFRLIFYADFLDVIYA
jgi:hypothetical protein